MASLRAASGSGSAGRWDRVDLTMVITMLRAGVELADAWAVAPGLSPSGMLAAYEHVERMRAQAERSWAQLCDKVRGVLDGTLPADALVGEADAAKLLPGPCSRLVTAAIRSDGRLRNVLATEERQVQECRAVLERIFDQIERAATPDEARELGRQIYSPSGECLMHHPAFLPARVGELSSLRVADLIGERRGEPLSI